MVCSSRCASPIAHWSLRTSNFSGETQRNGLNSWFFSASWRFMWRTLVGVLSNTKRSATDPGLRAWIRVRAVCSPAHRQVPSSCMGHTMVPRNPPRQVCRFYWYVFENYCHLIRPGVDRIMFCDIFRMRVYLWVVMTRYGLSHCSTDRRCVSNYSKDFPDNFLTHFIIGSGLKLSSPAIT